jgi:hypothetical protein
MSNVVTTWGQLGNAPWSNRSGHKSVVLSNGDVIMCGGVDNTNSYKNDVWKYSNNKWVLVRASVEWAPRFNHILLKSSDLLGDKLILLGGIGLNKFIGEPETIYDAWQSLDNGETWRTFVNLPRTIEEGYIDGVILSDNTIIITTQSQVWALNNDGTWNQISGQLQQPPWRIRIDYALHVLSDDSLIIAGGIRSGLPLNDIWISRNRGLQWTQLNPQAEWEPRSGHKIVSLSNGTLALLSGTDSFSNTYYGDIWISSNGVNWVKYTSTYIGRELFSVVPISNNILLFGGKSVTSIGGNIITTIYNDVWEYESFSFSFSLSSSPFSINSDTQNKKTTLPNNELTIDINIPENLASYIASTSTQFQIQLIKDENIIQTINTPSTITFPFNDFDGTNWKVITYIDINGSLLQQEIPFTFTNFPPLQPKNISYAVSGVSDNSYNYDVFFDYDRSLSNVDTNYPLPLNVNYNNMDYPITQVSNLNGVYKYKFTVPNNTIALSSQDTLITKIGSLTSSPATFTLSLSFLQEIISPTYSFRYTTSPLKSFVDISFEYNNEFGIDQIDISLNSYSQSIVPTDKFQIPTISFEILNSEYSFAFDDTNIQITRFGEKTIDKKISNKFVTGIDNFDLNVNTSYDGTNHLVEISANNITPNEFTNAIYQIVDISTVETTTPTYTFVFPNGTYFGQVLDISVTLYKVNLNTRHSERTKTIKYEKPKFRISDAKQTFDYINNKIKLEFDASASITNLDISYSIPVGDNIINAEDTYDNIFPNNKLEIFVEDETLYGGEFTLTIFAIEQGIPKNYNDFGIISDYFTDRVNPPELKTLTASERPKDQINMIIDASEQINMIIDASFTTDSSFNKARLVIDASDVSGVFNEIKTDFINQGTYYDISAEIDATYLGREIDVKLKIIDVNETDSYQVMKEQY